MNCKGCGSNDVTRSRRRGLWDRIQSTLGFWPYRCDDCGLRFTAPHRYREQKTNTAEPRFKKGMHNYPGPDFRAYAATAERKGPDMAFETHAERPHAKIVLQADTHEQLNQILLTLNRAVNSYQASSKAGQTSAAESKPAAAAR